MADVSSLLLVTFQRLASVCMSLGSYDPLLRLTTRRFGCLSSCWSLRLGFSVSLYIRLSPPGSWIKLCVRPSVCGMRAWTCSATAKVKWMDVWTQKVRLLLKRNSRDHGSWICEHPTYLLDCLHVITARCWHSLLLDEVINWKTAFNGRLVLGHNIWAGALLYFHFLMEVAILKWIFGAYFSLRTFVF